MRHGNRCMQQVGCWLSSAVLLVALTTSVSAQGGDKEHRFLTGPLTIRDQGSFYIGGVPKVTNYAASPTAGAPQQIMVGQMYVQFQIPEKDHDKNWPVIMVHGSTHTAACLESTPDGREGWEPYFVRHGVPVYVVDQAGRGRSGFDESVIHEGEAMVNSGDVAGGTALIPSFGRITSNGAWTAWFGHLVPTGSTILTGTLIKHGNPGDPLCATDPSHCTYGPAFPIGTIDTPEAPANLPLTGTWGSAPLGPLSYYELNYYKQLVPNGWVARSWRRTRNPASWGTIWCGSSGSGVT